MTSLNQERFGRFLPALVVLLAVIAVSIAGGVPAIVLFEFSAYFVFGVVIPGTLVWRLCHGPTTTLVADLAAGAALGLALELALYLVFSAAGLERFIWIWPLLVLVSSLGWPRLRRCWRMNRRPQVAGVSWAISIGAIASVLLLVNKFRANPLAGSADSAYATATAVDMPFHQALGGGALNFFPPTMPYVIDEPLRYQFFVYEHFAAASWISTVDLTWIVYRLYAIPLVLILLVLACSLVWVQTKSVFAVCVMSAWIALSSPIALSTLDPAYSIAFLSPTLVYGAALFVPVILLVRDLTAPDSSADQRWLRWAMLVAFVLASTGGKATFVPLLMGGLAFALIVVGVVKRRVDRQLVALFVVAVGAAAFEYLVVLRGSSSGLAIAPFETAAKLLRISSIGELPIGWALLAAGAVILCFIGAASVTVMLVRDPEVRLDPTFLVLAGICLAAVGAAFLTNQEGLSQIYFLRSAWPYCGVLISWGLFLMLKRGLVAGTPTVVGLIVAGTVAGLVTSLVLAVRSASEGARIGWVVIVLAIVAVIAILSLRLHRAGTGRGRAFAGAVVACVLVGASMSGGVSALASVPVGPLGDQVPTSAGVTPIPAGGSQLAIWLRGQSSSHDLIATNAHCLVSEEDPFGGHCDARHFWITALTQRQALVEGWSYTASAYEAAAAAGIPVRYAPYWNEPQLRANDDVFYRPTHARIADLRQQYGVRWLFVDRTTAQESPRLRRLASLVQENDEAAVYDLG